METHDYLKFLPSVLGVLGLVLQFVLRSRRNVSDTFTITLGTTLAIGGYLLCADLSRWSADPRGWAIESLIAMPGYVGSVLGGIFATSSAAKAAVAAGANSENMFVPLTNSK